MFVKVVFLVAATFMLDVSFCMYVDILIAVYILNTIIFRLVYRTHNPTYYIYRKRDRPFELYIGYEMF